MIKSAAVSGQLVALAKPVSQKMIQRQILALKLNTSEVVLPDLNAGHAQIKWQ